MAIDISEAREKLIKAERNRKIRNIIITTIIILLIAGAIRACVISNNNIQEQRERLNSVPVPTLNAPKITSPY